jgi:hypothetical protein
MSANNTQPLTANIAFDYLKKLSELIVKITKCYYVIDEEKFIITFYKNVRCSINDDEKDYFTYYVRLQITDVLKLIFKGSTYSLEDDDSDYNKECCSYNSIFNTFNTISKLMTHPIKLTFKNLNFLFMRIISSITMSKINFSVVQSLPEGLSSNYICLLLDSIAASLDLPTAPKFIKNIDDQSNSYPYYINVLNISIGINKNNDVLEYYVFNTLTDGWKLIFKHPINISDDCEIYQLIVNIACKSIEIINMYSNDGKLLYHLQHGSNTVNNTFIHLNTDVKPEILDIINKWIKFHNSSSIITVKNSPNAIFVTNNMAGLIISVNTALLCINRLNIHGEFIENIKTFDNIEELVKYIKIMYGI